MPSVSKKQHNLMAAVAKNPAFAKKAGIPQRVGADFLKADKGRKFAKGGDMAKKMPPFMGKETKAEEAKEMQVKAKSPAMYRKGEKAEGVHGKSGMKKPTKYASGGFTSCADGKAKQGRTKAQQFAMGGMPVGMAGPQGMTPKNPVMTNTAARTPPSTARYVTPMRPSIASNAERTPPTMTPYATTKPVGMAPRPSMTGTSQVGKMGKVGDVLGKIFGGVPKEGRRGDSGYSVPGKLGLQYGPRMTTEQQKKLGESLGKMMGGLRAKGAKEMASRGGTGFNTPNMMDDNTFGAKKGGAVKKFASGGSIDGCATKGKTKGKGRIF